MNEKDKFYASVRFRYLTYSRGKSYQNIKEFLNKYLSQVVHGDFHKTFNQVESVLDMRKSLKENLFRISLKVFQDLIKVMAKPEKLEFFMKVLDKMHISYPNLEFFIERLIDEGIEKISEVFFYTLSSFLSQYYRGSFFKVNRPHVDDRFYLELLKSNELNLSLAEQIRRNSNIPKLVLKSFFETEEREIFKERLDFTGFLHSEVYCEDCIIYIAPFYQSIFEGDILLEISKKFPFAIFLFFRGFQLFISISDSLYKKIRPEKAQKGRITLYNQLKPLESAIVSEGSLIKLGNSNEFLIKTIDFQEKTVLVKFLFGVFKSRIISYKFSHTYNEKNIEIPLSDERSSKICINFEVSLDSLLITNESKYANVGVSVKDINITHIFNEFSCLTLDDKSGKLHLVELEKVES